MVSITATNFLIWGASCVCVGIAGTMLFALDKFFPIKKEKPVPDPNDPTLRQQAVLLYYHDGAWEQAEVGGYYKAWDPVTKTNITVVVDPEYP